MIKKIQGIILIIIVLMLSVCGSLMHSYALKRYAKIYEGICIVLDAGHGGKDKGAQYNGVYESEINLAIVKFLKEELEKTGIQVLLTRSDENDLSDQTSTRRKTSDMKNRMKIINKEEVDLYISVHMNSFAHEEVKGTQIFCKKGNEDALYFASFIKNVLVDFNKKSFEIKTGDYYILNKTDKIGVLLECGFLSNPQERSMFANELYQKRFAKEIKKGIVNFLQDIYE